MGSTRTAEDVKPQRGIGDNGPPAKFTAAAKIARLLAMFQRPDLSTSQKLLGAILIAAADTRGIAELTTVELMGLGSIKDKSTVLKGTQALRERQLLEKESSNGQAGQYNVRPMTLEQTERIANELSGMIKPYRSETVTKPVKPDWSETEPDRLNHTGMVEPDWFDPSPSRARGLDNTLTKTNTSLEREEGEDRGYGGKENPEKEIDEPTPLSALEAFQLYNEMAIRVGLPQAQRLTPQRRKSMMARMRENGGIEAWKTALTNIERSKFLQGSNDRGWRANLDFLIQASSFSKVVDGTYGNGAHGEPASKFEQFAKKVTSSNSAESLAKLERIMRGEQ